MKNFYDIFNKRLYWLTYQAWKKYRLHLAFEDPFDKKYVKRIFSILGFATSESPEILGFSPVNLMPLSAILSRKVHNKSGLLSLLKAFFPHLRIRIIEFVPNKAELINRPQIGGKIEGKKFQLGNACVIGKFVTDYQSRIQLIFEDISFQEYIKFLSGEEHIKLLTKVLDFYLPDCLQYNLEFMVDSTTVPGTTLSNKELKLGQTTFLGKPLQRNVSIDMRYEEVLKKKKS